LRRELAGGERGKREGNGGKCDRSTLYVGMCSIMKPNVGIKK
jgi:hypothetical protein